ncbi:MAG: hypothetical protein RL311_734 [Bacteroidota bacterium]|jgi:hypothetical protein
MTKQVNKYLFNLVSADLKESQRVLPHYIDFSQKEKQNPDYWQKKVKATNNKIDLAKKTLEILVGSV